MPDEIKMSHDGESPYYDLFLNSESVPVFIDIMGTKMLLVHYIQDGGGQMFDFVDPRLIDLES